MRDDEDDEEEDVEEDVERGQGQGGAFSPAPPERQKTYEKFTNATLSLLYDQKAFQLIVKRLRAGAETDPIGTLAKLAVLFVGRASEGTNVADPDILQQTGAEVIEALAEISERADAHEYSDEDKQGALYRAADEYQAQLKQSGQLDSGRAQQDMERLKAGDDELAKIPGLMDLFKGKGQPLPPEEEDDAPMEDMPMRRTGMLAEA